MSERIAPRPGGRVTDHADALAGDARGARRQAGAKDDTRRSGIAGKAAGKKAGIKADTKADEVRGERAELVRGKGRRPEPAIKTRREEVLEERAARDRGKGVPAAGRRPVPDAPVDGTAALRVDAPVVDPVRRTGEVPAPPRLRVAPPVPVSAPRAPFVASVIGVVVVGVLGVLLINTKTNENSFRIADLQKQGAILDNQQADVQNQLIEASQVGNLDAAARRLGLVKAENPAKLRLPDGKIIGVLTPANGRPAITAQDAATPGGGNPVGDAGAGKVAPVNGSTTQNGEANGATNGQTGAGQTGAVQGGAVQGADGTANGASVGNGQTQSGTGQ
ncbi:hypothetical protein GCM10010172_58700 [Paractinoplanes ferrugineus]|uniref:Cell division protein FtsL n=1 Tax=Paractinoplanes ferrugineus TaxID=113564 RepID=A0A919J5E5_9ACTN|nr:hypothetical protein [Actinoplanes ferrugineus]GIE14333.1 hypothetical protein Afe05nite_61730 [Actinoplanes ferrugineus]